jgi:hypothetical protein
MPPLEDLGLPPVGSLPMFSQPPEPDPPVAPVTPTSTTTETPEPTRTTEDARPEDDGPAGGLLGRARRLATSATRTATSGGTGEGAGDPAVAAKLVASLAALVAAGAAFVVGRSGRSLRRPEKRHLDDFGRPMGRILVRHFDMTRLGPDLADGIEAGVVVGDYVAAGPLVMPAVMDHGRLISEEDEP